jgi:uncharacterized protein YkwD
MNTMNTMKLLPPPSISQLVLLGISLFSIIPGWNVGTTLNAAQAAPATHPLLALASPITKQQAIQQLALELANRDRAAAGLAPLQVDPLLSQAAQNHAKDMLRRNYFSHYSPDGEAPKDRLAAAGGTGYPAENIVMRYNSRFSRINIQLLEEFQNQWMHSAGHRRNLMNPSYVKFGYGFAIDPSSGKTFAVQMFTRS